MAKKTIYRKLGRVLLFVGLNLCFTAGIIWIAYSNRARIKKMMDHETSFSSEDKVILYDIFSSPLLPNEENLVFPAVKNSNDVIQYLYSSTISSTRDPISIYDSCRILSASSYRENIIKVRYLLFTDTLESYSYFNPINAQRTRTAIIHIPGSGDNRPVKVASRELTQEEPTNQALQIGADIYFPIFPADDILAIHDGTKMLDIKKIVPYLVTIRRNLSLRYLSDIFALKKWLSTNYTSLHVWGHSRGGSAATIASAIFQPDTLIVSSGYSIVNDKFFRLNSDQLWWSGANHFYDKNFIRQKLCNSKTKAWFLFGNKESDDMYGLEGKYFYTENFFKQCPNVKVAYTDHGHVWFGKEISGILGK